MDPYTRAKTTTGMELTITAEEIQTQWPRLLEQIRRGDTEVTITQGGIPVARVTAVRAERKPGMDAGQIQIAPDFDAPLPDDLLDAFEGR